MDTLRYLKTLIFGIFFPFERCLCPVERSRAQGHNYLQAEFHDFTLSALSHRRRRAVPAAWHCHRSPTMKHPTAVSPNPAPFRAGGPNPLAGGEPLCASASALTPSQGRRRSHFLAMGRFGEPMGFPPRHFQAAFAIS